MRRLSLLFIFIPLLVNAEVPDSNRFAKWKAILRAAPLDSNYITPVGDRLIINPYLISPSMNMVLQPYRVDSMGFFGSRFSPSLRTGTGLDISYKAIYLGFIFRNALTSADEKMYGQTRYRTTKFVISQRPWILELYNHKFQGLSDRNTLSFDSTRPVDEPYIKRQDLSVQYTKIKLIRYYGRGKYSYSSVFSYSEVQQRSKAAWMLVGNLGHYRVRADSAILSPLQQPYFGGFHDVNAFNVYSLSAGPGFGVNLVWEKLFLSFMSFYQVDFQMATLMHQRSSFKTHSSSIRAILEARFAMGYNSNNFFLVFNVKGDSNALGFPERGSRINYLAVTLDMGYRFRAPGLLREAYKRTFTRYLGL